MSKVQNDIKQTHIGNDNVSGISNNIISSPNMLNNSEKCPIPNKDLLSRKVIGLSFTGSGAGFISCPLFIVSVTGFVTALPISLAILGIGTTAVGLYLLLSGNEVRHNNSDNNASGNTNVSKNENYCNNSEYNKEINQKNNESKLIKIDTGRKQSINFDENAQNRQIHDHGINIEQNNGINIKNRPDLTNKDNISNNTSGEIHKNTAFNTKSDVVNDLSGQQKISANSFIHVVNKNNVPELGVGNNIDNNAKNYMPNYAQHSSATEIANKSNINNTITSTCDETKNIKKSSIQSNGGYNTGTHEQNDTQNQSLNQTIESNNLIMPGENTNGETIVDSHTIQGNPPINISGKKNPLYEPKESQLDELIINKNIIKIDKQELPPEPENHNKTKPQSIEKIFAKLYILHRLDPEPKSELESEQKLEPQPIEKIPTRPDTIHRQGPQPKPKEKQEFTQKPKDLHELKPETKQKPEPIEKIPTDSKNQPKPTPVIKPIEEISPIISIKSKHNDKPEPQSIRKILTGLNTIQKSELKPQPKPVKETSTIPVDLPKPEPKPTEEIQIRKEFLEYIYPENNKKNVNQENKQVQGRNAGRANEIPSQIQSKINLIIEKNANAFRVSTKHKNFDEKLEKASLNLNKLFTEYVLDVTKIKDKDKYTTKLSDISLEEKNSITKISCSCQIVKDGKSVFDFGFLAEFREDHDGNKFFNPWEFQFKFKDKSGILRAIPVKFPSKKAKS